MNISMLTNDQSRQTRAQPYEPTSVLQSAIYEGTVRHRRYTPKAHDFSYQVFMVYLDLEEIDRVFNQSRSWSCERFSLAWFRRKDFFDGASDTSLYDAVANAVEQETGRRPMGSIRMLSNLRYFGFMINPITCYYCFDATGQQLETIVAEVTNTPWKQRCHYILDCTHNNQDDSQDITFDKVMHVSPFQPMDLYYRWRGKTPSDHLSIHLDVFSKDDQSHDVPKPVFDATLLLQRQAMTTSVMNQKIRRYPWMTLKVCAAIYWQALRLWMKKIPFYGAPPTSTIEK